MCDGSPPASRWASHMRSGADPTTVCPAASVNRSTPLLIEAVNPVRYSGIV